MRRPDAQPRARQERVQSDAMPRPTCSASAPNSSVEARQPLPAPGCGGSSTTATAPRSSTATRSGDDRTEQSPCCEEVAVPGLDQNISGGTKRPFMSGKVLYANGPDARDEPAAKDHQEDQGDKRQRAARQAGTGSLERRAMPHVESDPEHRGEDRERQSQMRGEPIVATRGSSTRPLFTMYQPSRLAARRARRCRRAASA